MNNFNLQQYEEITINEKVFKIDISDENIQNIINMGDRLKDIKVGLSDDSGMEGYIRGKETCREFFNTIFVDEPFEEIYKMANGSTLFCVGLLENITTYIADTFFLKKK